MPPLFIPAGARLECADFLLGTDMASEGRVLVVEDDPAVRALIAEYLGGHGYEIREAADGAAMRAAIAQSVPDVVLLDLNLRGENGLALARWLREHHACGIIMVTAASDIVDRVVGLEVGADDYVAKPFDPRELVARVRSVVRRLRDGRARSRGRPHRRSPSARCASTSPGTDSSRRAARKCRSPPWNSTCCACSPSIRTACCRGTSSSR